MAIKVGGTTVIDNNIHFQNLTGITNSTSRLQPASTGSDHATGDAISGSVTFDVNDPITIKHLSGALTVTDLTNKAEGKSCMIYLDVTESGHDITWGTNFTFKNDSEPDWTTARYWQIACWCWDGTEVKVVANSWGGVEGAAVDTTLASIGGGEQYYINTGIWHQAPSSPGYTKTYNGNGGSMYGYAKSLQSSHADISADYHVCDVAISTIITSTSNSGSWLSSWGFTGTQWCTRIWNNGSDSAQHIVPGTSTYTQPQGGMSIPSGSSLGSYGTDWNAEFESAAGTVFEVVQILWAKNTQTTGTFPSAGLYSGSHLANEDTGNFVTISLKRKSGTAVTESDNGLFKSIKLASTTFQRTDGETIGSGDYWNVTWTGSTDSQFGSSNVVTDSVIDNLSTTANAQIAFELRTS